MVLLSAAPRVEANTTGSFDEDDDTAAASVAQKDEGDGDAEDDGSAQNADGDEDPYCFIVGSCLCFTPYLTIILK